MGTLKELLKQVLAGYTKRGLNGYSYLAVDPDERLFTSVVVGWLDGKQFAFADLIVQLVGDRVIINQDANDKPLVEALLQAGVSRQQIILAYAGEPVPETASAA